MLRTKIKKYVLLSCAVFVLIIAAAVCCAFHDGSELAIPCAVFGAIIAVLLLVTVTMALILQVSLKQTMYAYKNIVLIGTMLFTFPYMIVLLVKFITRFSSDSLTLQYIFDSLIDFPRQFAIVSAIGILVICLMVGISNIELMRHEGVRLHNALGIILAIAELLVLYISVMTRKGFPGIGGAESKTVHMLLDTVLPLFFLLLICYFDVVFIGTVIMGWAAARHIPSYDKDYIIILGCSINKKGGLLPLLKGRVNRAIRFAWEQEIAAQKPLKYVPSGGQGDDEVMSEGSAMELYLLTRGAEGYEVFPEKKSRSTYENMCFSKQIIDSLMPDAKVAFATTNYHILRGGMMARRAGFDAEGIAGDTKWYFWPNGFIREFVGILVMYKNSHLIVAGILAFICAVMGCIGAMI